jgi:hypothetical protein
MMRMAARVTLASETSGSSSKGIVTDLGAEMREGRMRSFPRWSGNPAGHRHTETGHDKDDLAGDFGLGLLCVGRLRALRPRLITFLYRNIVTSAKERFP